MVYYEPQPESMSRLPIYFREEGYVQRAAIARIVPELRDLWEKIEAGLMTAIELLKYHLQATFLEQHPIAQVEWSSSCGWGDRAEQFILMHEDDIVAFYCSSIRSL